MCVGDADVCILASRRMVELMFLSAVGALMIVDIPLFGFICA